MRQVTCVSDLGAVRKRNEDAVLVAPWILSSESREVAQLTPCPERPVVVAVIDGMGGHAGGQAAAGIAARTIAAVAHEMTTEDGVKAAVERANAAVYAAMSDDPALRSMGATIAGVVFVDDDAIVFNVGDSRVHVETDGYLTQLSTDDLSVTQSGALSQSLGGLAAWAPVDVHVVREPIAGRRFLLATDGLGAVVPLGAMERCMRDDAVATVEGLRRSALDAGGPDNVSILLIETPTPDASREP